MDIYLSFSHEKVMPMIFLVVSVQDVGPDDGVRHPVLRRKYVLLVSHCSGMQFTLF